MPSPVFGLSDHDETDDAVNRQFGVRQTGKALPPRSRSGANKLKQNKARTSRSKRKAQTPNGIHQRRNKRVSW